MHRAMLAAGVVAIAIAGCGGGNGNVDGAAGTLTKAEFVKQAARVCEAAVVQTKRERERDIFEQFIFVQRRKAVGIARLAPPPALRAPYEAYVKVLNSRLRLGEQIRDAVRAHTRPLALEREIEPMQVRERKAAIALGVTRCRDDR